MMKNSMFDKIIKLFFVKKCVACRDVMPYDSNEYLCDECASKWKKEKTEICPVCLKGQTKCVCGFGRSELDSVRHLAMYSHADNNSVAKGLVFALKKSNDSDVFDFVAKEIAGNLIGNVNAENTIVINVPRNPNTVREVGYDHAKKLAERIALLLSVRYVDVLGQKKNKKEQKTLNSMQRMENARKNFYYKSDCQENINGYNVILVDDIGTTGATLKVCAELLKKNGAKSVRAAVAAKNKYINKKT